MPTIFRDKVTVRPLDEVDTVNFNDFPNRPFGSVDFKIYDLAGWDTSPELDVVTSPYGSNTDGEVAADFFAARARHLVVAGYVYARDRASAETIRDVIERDAFPRNRDLEMVRYEGTPKRMTVRVSGPRDFRFVEPYAFYWSTTLIATDPFKYSLDSEVVSAGVAGFSSGGRTYPRLYPMTYTTTDSGDGNKVSVYNAGTAYSPPIVTIWGPLLQGGWRLVNLTTGGTIRFDVGLSATDILVIDFKSQTALLNGYPVTSTVGGDFWKVAPKTNDIKLYANYDPNAGFSVTVYSAWE